jgi:2-haloacid dehalogenase
MGITPDAKALLFDVFGTCVDWRTTVTHALAQASLDSLHDTETLMTGASRARARRMSLDDWGAFAQTWRNTYYDFTRSVANDASMQWKTVDDHHLESLQELLVEFDLLPNEDKEGLWTNDQIRHLSLIWHKLDPWPDTVAGLEALNTKFETSTLSNGNISLLKDMQAHSGMRFKHTLSSENFGSYKPNPAIYLGAAKELGLEPSQCVMIAAHLGDLKAAKKCGFQTVYVQREQEEKGEAEVEAKKKGFVDLWIDLAEDGLVTVAERLGCVVKS